MKSLEPNLYILELVSDLGMLPVGGYRSDNGKPRKARFVELRCTCGSVFSTQATPGKKVKTCRSCRSKLANLKHGDSKSRVYHIWQQMLKRTTDGRCGSENYADRGISVCKEWKDYLAFKDWALSNGYDDSLTIDRKDNDGNYEPSNCRWTTQTVQGRNTRKLFKHNTSGYRGVTYDKSRDKWLVSIKVNNKRKHIGRFSSAKEGGEAYDEYVTKHGLEHTKNET